MLNWTLVPNGTGRDGTIQEWVVPFSGQYRITALGAQGGTGSRLGTGGRGAKMSGTFLLQEGERLHIAVGQQGEKAASHESISGGGGSFIGKALGTVAPYTGLSVAFLVRNTTLTPYELSAIGLLEAVGHRVTVVAEANVVGYDFTYTDVAVVGAPGDNFTSHPAVSTIQGLTCLVVSLCRSSSRDMGLASSSGSRTVTDLTCVLDIHVIPVSLGIQQGQVLSVPSATAQGIYSLNTGTTEIFHDGTEGYPAVAEQKTASTTRRHFSYYRLDLAGVEVGNLFLATIDPDAFLNLPKVEPLIVAGGGGGFGVGNTDTYQDRAHAHTQPWGKDGYGTHSWGTGGVDGNGGQPSDTRGTGGGGYYTSGEPHPGGGRSFIAGALGGDGAGFASGGFGGGGAVDRSTGWGAAGGGGGYSGGGGAYSSSDITEAVGGGGGSFNMGTDQVNEDAFQSGDGLVEIEFLGGSLTLTPTWDETTETYTYQVEWEADDDATEYRLALYQDTTLIEEITTPGLSHSFVGMMPETRYRFLLTPFNASGDLEPIELSMTLPVGLPSVVPGFGYDFTHDSLSFFWDAASNADEYHLYLELGGVEVGRSFVPGLTFTFSALEYGTQYSVRIYAVNADGLMGPETVIPAATNSVPLDMEGDPYAEIVFKARPLAFWRLRDPAGAMQVKDEMKRFNGTVNGPSPFGGNPNLVPTGFGRSAHFDGSTWLDMGEDDALAPINSMAIEFWLKPTDDSDRKGLIHQAYGGSFGSVYEPSNEVRFYRGSGGGDSGSNQSITAGVPLNVARHVVFERDNDLGTVTIYVNGYPVTRAEDEYPTGGRGNNTFKIGKSHVTDLFKGYIQDVAIYDRALGDEEIADHVEAAGLERPFIPEFGYFSVPGLQVHTPWGWNSGASEEHRIPNPTAISALGLSQVMGEVRTNKHLGWFDQVDGSGGSPSTLDGVVSDPFRQGVIQGSITAATGKGASRRLRVTERRTGRVVREGWSKTDGTYRFDDLDPNKEWVVTAYDHAGRYNALIADRIRSVVTKVTAIPDPVIDTVSWFSVSGYSLTLHWALVKDDPTEIRVYMSESPFTTDTLPEPLIIPGNKRELIDTRGKVFVDQYAMVSFVYDTTEEMTEIIHYDSTTEKPEDWGKLNDMIHWYPLNGDTLDYVGDNHAINSGAVSKVDGYSFTPADKLTIEEVWLTPPFSAGYWFKPDISQFRVLNGDTYYEAIWHPNLTSVQFDNRKEASGNRSTVDIVPSFVTNEWHHFVVSVEADGTASVYVGGALKGIGLYQGPLAINKIGGKTNDTGYSAYSGSIRDVRLFDRPLTQDEVNTYLAGG